MHGPLGLEDAERDSLGKDFGLERKQRRALKMRNTLEIPSLVPKIILLGVGTVSARALNRDVVQDAHLIESKLRTIVPMQAMVSQLACFCVEDVATQRDLTNKPVFV